MRNVSCSIGPPFSANNMYVPTARGRMSKSKKYRQWLEKVVPEIQEKLSPAEAFPIRIEIFVLGGRGWSKQQDVDNVCKPIIDALVKAEIIPDDNNKYVEYASVRFLPGPNRYGEALTRISYTESEKETYDWD
jgi:Holliday junction resolvase RusA-like endonuclease